MIITAMSRAQTLVVPALLLLGVCSGSAEAPTAYPAKGERVVMEYAASTNPKHSLYRDLLERDGVMERMRDGLRTVRWPRTLRIDVKGCDGDANAYYDNASITVCYEFLDDFWTNAHSPTRPGTIGSDDAFLGPVLDTFLHEAAHAAFDLLKIPVLGREEDAADQVATYFLLRATGERKRALVLGIAYGYSIELRLRSAYDLYRPRFTISQQAIYAGEHSTPAQRLFNVLCLAYGSNKELFTDLVEQRYLPPKRAEMCEGEYRQIDHAYRTLLAPHIDEAHR